MDNDRIRGETSSFVGRHHTWVPGREPCEVFETECDVAERKRGEICTPDRQCDLEPRLRRVIEAQLVGPWLIVGHLERRRHHNRFAGSGEQMTASGNQHPGGQGIEPTLPGRPPRLGWDQPCGCVPPDRTTENNISLYLSLREVTTESRWPVASNRIAVTNRSSLVTVRFPCHQCDECAPANDGKPCPRSRDGGCVATENQSGEPKDDQTDAGGHSP